MGQRLPESFEAGTDKGRVPAIRLGAARESEANCAPQTLVMRLPIPDVMASPKGWPVSISSVVREG